MTPRTLPFLLVLLWSLPASAQSVTPEQTQATVAYVQSLQKPNGGFAADSKPETPATLPATASAVRALKYFGGKPKNREAAVRFIQACRDDSGVGFAPTPGGKQEVRSTAVAIMAAPEVGLFFRPDDEVFAFLNTSAITFEDIRIAAAAFETAKDTPNPKAKAWITEIHKLRNPNGTYGKSGNLVRDTGGAAAAVLRLGGSLEHQDILLRALKSGQQPDGGWTKEGQKGADLESSYRVMRAFVMLKEKPDVAACRKFVASCRNADGSYSVQPGQPGNISATYFAGIILHWLDEMK